MPVPKDSLIYIVEDDFITQEILERQLELLKYTNIRRFSTGDECLEVLDKKPGLIILDYYLADVDGKNGEDVFMLIKARSPETKVVMLSAQEDGEVVIRLIKQGLRDYIIKDSNMLAELMDVMNN